MIHHDGAAVSAAMNQDTLYYNGNCSLCRHEVHRLKHLSQGTLQCCDISNNAPLPDGLERQQLQRQLHLVTADGDLLTGLSANIRAWQHTPYGHWAKLLDWPPLRPLVRHLYRLWLWLYQRYLSKPQ